MTCRRLALLLASLALAIRRRRRRQEEGKKPKRRFWVRKIFSEEIFLLVIQTGIKFN